MAIFSKKYILLIQASPWVEVKSYEEWMMGENMTYEYLLEYGQKKHDAQKAEGKPSPVNPKYYYNKRKRYMRYMDYREALRAEARRVLYMPQTNNFWMKFYFPIPKSYSKKQRNILAWEPMLKRPDVSNLVAAVEDAFFEEDNIIWDYRASKFWTPMDKGHIEIQVGGMEKAIGYTKILSATDELK